MNNGVPHVEEIFGSQPDPLGGARTAEDIKAKVDENKHWPNGKTAPDEPVEPWPEPMSDAAFYGLPGDFVWLVQDETEADPHALLLCLLVEFGCMVGRSPFYQVEATRHGVNLFLVLVGETGNGRKGTAQDRAENMLRLVDQDFFDKRRVSGLSTGEGLIHAIRDEREDDVIVDKGTESQRIVRKVVDTGEPDKRLLAIEAELASVFQQFGRLGNTLSSVIRNAFDAKPLRIMARSNKDSCRDPHVSMIGHITPEELPRLMTSTEKANGFGNRILWCCSKRSRLLPYGGNPLNPEKLRKLVSDLKAALRTAQSIGEVTLDDEAYRAWAPAYKVLTEGASGLFGAMTARGAPLVLRLATIYALLDQSSKIKLVHLRAAQEVWGYCEDSVRCIFGDTLGDETADAILRMLRNAPDGMTQTEISYAFGRHKSAAELSRALSLLQKRGRVTFEQQETGGAPATIWRAIYAN